MRLLAVDGTRLVLPSHPTVVQEFGVNQFGPKVDSPRYLTMGSLLYDVLNLITIDSQIEPYASSERYLLMQHIDQVKPGDLLLFDRGYPRFWIQE